MVVCNQAPLDSHALWMTVSAVGNLATIDAMLESLIFLHEAQEASTEHVTQHLSEWRRQRADKLDRPGMWSLLRRRVHSTQLDTLFAHSPAAPQPSVHSQAPRIPYSPSASTVSSSEPCDRYLLSMCNNAHCRLSHSPDKPYAAWLAERLRCHHCTMTELPFFEPTLKGVLSDNSGQPAKPLIIALPMPSLLLPSRCLRPNGPLMEHIQRRVNVFVNVPRTDQDQSGTYPWGIVRSRGDTRQVDALIEWCCSLMDEWKAYSINSTNAHSQQLQLATNLSERMEKWLQRRAEYVAQHGEALFSFISRGLGAQVRLSFPLPAAAVEDAHSTQAASLARRNESSSPPSSLSPASSSSTSSSSSSDRSSGGSSGSTSSSTSAPASPASTVSSFPSLPLSVSPPVDPDPALQLAVMRAAGLRLAYSSFVQHPAFSATAQPFIRVLSSQAFGCWPIPAAWRETFVWTLDEQAVALSVFEQRWGVEVYAPSGGGGGGGGGSSGSGGGDSGGGSGGGGSRRGSEGGGSGGSSGGGHSGGHSGGSSSGSSSGGMQWCNVCVRMQLGSSSEQAEPGSAQVEAAEECGERVLDAVMLAVMQRARRVGQLVGVH